MIVRKGVFKMYEISLAANVGAEEQTLKQFIQDMKIMNVEEYKSRYTNKKVTYIYLRLTPKGNNAVQGACKGRPNKLTDEEIEKVKDELSKPGCNKSQLAREFKVSYQTILKISKGM